MKNIFKNTLGNKTEQKRKDFEAVVFPLMDRLYTTALSMTKDPLDAEDLVQETYLRAYRFFHSFKRGTNFGAWMYRILTNNYINVYRGKKREPLQVDFETTCVTFANEYTSEIDKNKVADLNANYDEVFDDSITAALDKLPEQYRMAVMLCDVNELNYKEIAEVVGCPIGTVMSRLSRGRKMLAKFLKPYAEANGYVGCSK